jgi:hypothetical protein
MIGIAGERVQFVQAVIHAAILESEKPEGTFGFSDQSSRRSRRRHEHRSGFLFFEWLGSKDGTLEGGSAYNGNTKGNPDDVMNTLVGDRVFLLEMTVTPETTSTSLPG